MRKRNIDTIVIGYGPLLNEYTMTEQYVDLIKKAAPGATLVIVKNQEEWDQRKEELGPRVEVVFGFRPATWFHEMPNLKWVQQAGATPKYFDRLVEIFTENLDRYQAGEQMINVVDKKLGY